MNQKKSSLKLDISKGWIEFDKFLRKQKNLDCYIETKREYVFTGELQFFLDEKKLLKRVKREVPDYAEVGRNEDYGYDPVKHRHVTRRNRSEAIKRFYEKFDSYGYIKNLHEKLDNDFGVINVFESMMSPPNVGVIIKQLTLKKLFKLEKEFKDYKVRLQGLFCTYPDEIVIKVPYKTKIKYKCTTRTAVKLNHIFEICLLGEEDKVRKQKDLILSKYRKLKFD